MALFVDTSAFFALVAANDTKHEMATSFWRSLARAGEDPVTHNYVVIETAALLQRRAGLEAVRQFDRILTAVEVGWIDPELHREAFAALLALGRRGVSLVDTVSFEFMRTRGINQAFALDDDFQTAGFQVVPA